MASWVQVANAIGAAIGTETRISDPDDDRTLARAIRAVWDLNRRAALREGSWNFATERHQLPEMTDAPPFGFAHQYKLPGECLRLLEVNDEVADDAYQLEGGKILCDVEGPLNIRCVVDKEEPGTWDDSFVAAFALRVAWQIGTKIAGSSFDKEKTWRSYQDELASAKRVDARENPPLENDESDWILARDMPAPYGLRR